MADIEQTADYQDRQGVVAAFTHGLRALPSDTVTRVSNFITEYLGSSRQPVPFGGRLRDFGALDNWLTQGTVPYILLAAPAGRGKSALLLRWCQRLLSRADLALVYFPVSIRFRTNLAGVAFPALVALLATLHGEQVPNDPNLSEEVWRGLLNEYMKRPLADGRVLLVILDGVDEAGDWSAGPDLFPTEPPQNLRVVLSARYLANDQGSGAWLQRLGWTRPGLATTLDLFPLDHAGIANVLQQMGFPLDLLGTRINIVSELYRLSEGDPLLVRLYVDDLWARGEAVVRFQPEDLHTIRPGLVGYFERWWSEQRLLWGEQAEQRETVAQSMLGLLAGALGPLTQDDILNLLTDEVELSPAEVAEYVAPLARFVTGDGIYQGYVFSHPRLGNYFLEEHLSEQERQQVEARFLSWGKRTVTALNEDRLAPGAASGYIVQYYGAHLERAHAAAPELLLLVNNGWRRAWEKLDRANAGFLGDVGRAWRAAERADAAACENGEAAPFLEAELRCLLSQVSVNSVTSNISSRLMLEAVKTGVWTAAQGLASIRLITEPAARARELVGLAPHVGEPQRTDILQEAVDTAMSLKEKYDRLDALLELAPGLSKELLWLVLEQLPTIEDEADRAGVLTDLAPSLAAHAELLEQALTLVRDFQEEEYRALALAGLAPYFSAEQQEHALALVEPLEDERYQAQVFLAILPQHPPGELLQRIKQFTQNIKDGVTHIRLLAELVLALPEPAKTETLRETLELVGNIEDRAYRVEVLVRLAPVLSEDELKRALDEVRVLWDETLRSVALQELGQYLPEPLLPEAVQHTLQFKSEELRRNVLLPLLPRLAEPELEQVFENVQTIWDEGLRAELLARLIDVAPEALVPQLVQTIDTIGDQGYRAWLLAELEHLLGNKITGVPGTLPAAFQTIPDRAERLQTLLAIVPLLSQQALDTLLDIQLPEIFGMNWRFQTDEQRAHILVKIGPHLHTPWLERATEAVQAMREEHYQVQVLVALAPTLPPYLLSQALGMVRALKDREKRGVVLEALVSSLPEARKAERVQEMLQVLQVIKDEDARMQLVVRYTPLLQQEQLANASTLQILQTLRHTLGQEQQVRILEALLPKLPEEALLEALTVVRSITAEEKRAALLELLAPRFPQRHFRSLLEQSYTLREEQLRKHTLSRVLAFAPEEILVELLEQLQSTTHEVERSERLDILAPHAPQQLFPRLWEVAQTISEDSRYVQALGAIAPKLPADYFPRFWDAVRTIPNDGWQVWVIRILAPHLSEELFGQMLQKTLELRNRDLRTLMLTMLIHYMPERFFTPLWERVPTLPDDNRRWQLLERLAPHVPPEHFADFFNAVQNISSDQLRIQTLEALAPRIPEAYFPQVWQFALQQRMWGRPIPLFKAILDALPPRQLPFVWEMAQQAGIHELTKLVLRRELPLLAQEDRLKEVVLHLEQLPTSQVRLELLEVLAPTLSEKQAEQFIALLKLDLAPETLLQGKTREEVRALALLLPQLPLAQREETLPTLLQTIHTTKSEDERAWLLTRLAQRMPENLLEALLEELWSLNTAQNRALVLHQLLPGLTTDGWTKLLGLTTSRSRATGAASSLLELFQAADPVVVEHVSPSQLYPALRELIHLLALRTRSEALSELLPLGPVLSTLGVEGIMTEICGTTLEVGRWWP